MPPQRGRRTRLGGKLGIPCADPNESALSNALRGIGRRRASIDALLSTASLAQGVHGMSGSRPPSWVGLKGGACLKGA